MFYPTAPCHSRSSRPPQILPTHALKVLFSALCHSSPARGPQIQATSDSPSASMPYDSSQLTLLMFFSALSFQSVLMPSAWEASKICSAVIPSGQPPRLRSTVNTACLVLPGLSCFSSSCSSAAVQQTCNATVRRAPATGQGVLPGLDRFSSSCSSAAVQQTCNATVRRAPATGQGVLPGLDRFSLSYGSAGVLARYMRSSTKAWHMTMRSA
eukprot:1156565-Pelagomonas_calceolata.AAC.4